MKFQTKFRRFKILTQLTTGGRREAEIATPINGPALPWSKATATPEPDVKAHKTPIHRDRAFPLLNTQTSFIFIFGSTFWFWQGRKQKVSSQENKNQLATLFFVFLTLNGQFTFLSFLR
jgi:hypothetical protein